jgi:hypothetical protein
LTLKASTYITPITQGALFAFPERSSMAQDINGS